MPPCTSSAVVTRAVDLLSAAGFKVLPMQGAQRVDGDECDVTGLSGCKEERRQEDLSLVRDAFAFMKAPG